MPHPRKEFESAVLSVFGKQYFVGGEGVDYGDKWSPNIYRTLVLTSVGAITEKHPCFKGEVYSVKAFSASTVRWLRATYLNGLDNMVQSGWHGVPAASIPSRTVGYTAGRDARLNLSFLRTKKLSTLEEIIIDPSLQISDNFFQQFDNTTRLRSISSVSIGSWEEFQQFIHVLKEARSKGFDGPFGGKIGGINVLSDGPSSNDWYNKYQLNPKVYRADLKGGELETYFSGIQSKYNPEAVKDTGFTGNASALQSCINIDEKQAEQYLELYRILKILYSAVKSGGTEDKVGCKILGQGIEKAIRTDRPVLGLHDAIDASSVAVSSQLEEIYNRFGYAKPVDKGYRKVIPNKGFLPEVQKVLEKPMATVIYHGDSLRMPLDKAIRPDIEGAKHLVDMLLGNYESSNVEELMGGPKGAALMEEFIKLCSNTGWRKRPVLRVARSDGTPITGTVNNQEIRKILEKYGYLGEDIEDHGLGLLTDGVAFYQTLAEMYFPGLEVGDSDDRLSIMQAYHNALVEHMALKR